MSAGPVSRRGWILLAAMALIWGVPYLFIKEAVGSYSPAAIVAGRTLIGGLILLPFAIRSGALRAALRHWPWVLAFGAVEMGGPFLLLGHAEQTLPSGITGLLVATVPLFGTVIAIIGGDRGVLKPLRIVGIAMGFFGVAVIVLGPGVMADGVSPVAVAEVLLVAVLYAIAPFIVARKLHDVPSMGTITLSVLAVGLFYLPIALVTPPTGEPTVRASVAIIVLGVLCTAIAFLVFFALIREIGPARAPLFTYANPIVAILLGAVILSEPITPALLIGFPLVIIGCWLAATGGRFRERPKAATDLPAPTPLA